VHLGSERFPDDKEYKAYLAQHGGSSNASTSESPLSTPLVCCARCMHGPCMHQTPPLFNPYLVQRMRTHAPAFNHPQRPDMVHTQYHLRVQSAHLPGALDRTGAMLAAPLLSAEAAAREVENVHAEFSRNCNSDGRKLLQLRRSLGRPPYSQFSTGSISTLRDAPQEAGVDVAAALRGLWRRRYLAPATTVAVLGPQDPSALEAWVRDAFAGIAAARDGSGDGSGDGIGNGAVAGRHGDLAGIYGEEQRGTLLRVAPSRDLRTLELLWFVPHGALERGDSKPWRAAAHVLGHEACGSAAHLLKRQGLIQVSCLDLGRCCGAVVTQLRACR
jgi:insulysin